MNELYAFHSAEGDGSMMEHMGQEMGNMGRMQGMAGSGARMKGGRTVLAGPVSPMGYCRFYKEKSERRPSTSSGASLFRESSGKETGKNPPPPSGNRLSPRKMAPVRTRGPLRTLQRKIRTSPEKPHFAKKCDGVHGHFVPFVGECVHGGFKNGKDHCRI